MAGGPASERKVFAIWCETRRGRTCKTNVQICDIERIQGHNGIKQYNPYNLKFSRNEENEHM